MLFLQAIKKYQEYLKSIDRSPRTIQDYSIDLNFFRKYLEVKLNGPVYVEDIAIGDIEEFLRMLKEERKYKPSSRKRMVVAIKMFYKFLYKKKLIKEDIGIELEPVKVVPEERDYITEEETIEFVKAVNHQVCKVVIYTMFYAGLRISECVNLKVEDVDLESKIIHVINGKGSKDRKIPISSKLYPKLKDYMACRAKSEYYFSSEATGRISRVRIAAIIRNSRKKLGIKKQITPHTFRHGFASHLVKNNANIVAISKLMGHSNIKVTSVYTHAGMDILEDTVKLI